MAPKFKEVVNVEVRDNVFLDAYEVKASFSMFRKSMIDKYVADETRPNLLPVVVEKVTERLQDDVRTVITGSCRNVGTGDEFVCSECGCRLVLFWGGKVPTMYVEDGDYAMPSFCPSCGAKVEG